MPGVGMSLQGFLHEKQVLFTGVNGVEENEQVGPVGQGEVRPSGHWAGLAELAFQIWQHYGVVGLLCAFAAYVVVADDCY